MASKQLTFRPGSAHEILGSSGRAIKEFHISRTARERYGFDRSLFSASGNVVFADVHAARIFAYRMNKVRRVSDKPQEAIRTADLNAMGLIDEILHYAFELYLEQHGTELLSELAERLENGLGKEKLERTLSRFCEQFPPLAVYNNEMSVSEYLDGDYEGRSGRSLALEEIVLLKLANENPAFGPFSELFDESELAESSSYAELMRIVEDFFPQKPVFGPRNQTLLDMLRSPRKEHPYSLQDQLAYLRTEWGSVLGQYLFRLLRSVDLIREEEKTRGGPGMGPGPTYVYTYQGYDEDVERFSPDQDWMPSVVMLAKSTLVWLDQLSRKYQREIVRLDQVPDDELDNIASCGFNALWLIGLWQRSKASKRIKQIMGNEEAEASAYSLMDYEIAERLGGWDALDNLRGRCRVRGIRVASDMVPNHTGIDGKWVEEHPDWFVQLDHPPFPSYSFTGENLSNNPAIGVFLEDHYYDHSDAAVVFKREDFGSGDVRYIYHGNDGTSMPWNDTAQLNYLMGEVREAVMQTILHVARNFPIIRFDAAMTLAKKHVQRLWFPPPGSGGDIPSRAEHGLTQEDFDRAMPEEFWREVVDRVAEEAPDTLLLAEAFWMMESYFVRTLGMHRVYNSAFMNMLKNEENAKYRETVKNTLSFDPEILKRFVNFLNNPDEETAVAQFGKGDKYFGVTALMVTMPGLPMFGHGQVEGFAEKYGMEYTRAYWEEDADQDLVDRHRREIFPLMHKRYLFSGVENFNLYDVYDADGKVNENVYAYSNSAGHERALFVFNNAYDQSHGWIRTSVPYVAREAEGKSEKRRELGQALQLHNEYDYYCIMREHNSKLWFVRRSSDIHEHGMAVALNGYQHQVFLDIYEVQDNEFKHFQQLNDRLGGSGVPDIDDALKELFLGPLHERFARLLSADNLELVGKALGGSQPVDDSALAPLRESYKAFADNVPNFAEVRKSPDAAFETYRRLTASLAALSQAPPPRHKKADLGRIEEDPFFRETIAAVIATLPLERFYPPIDGETPQAASSRGTEAASSRGTKADAPSAAGGSAESIAEHSTPEPRDLSAPPVSQALWLAEELMLPRVAERLMEERGIGDERAWWWRSWFRVATILARWLEEYGPFDAAAKAPSKLVHAIFEDVEMAAFLQTNTYEGVVWFDRDRYGLMRETIHALDLLVEVGRSDKREPTKASLSADALNDFLLRAEDISGYQVGRLLEFADGVSSTKAAKKKPKR